VATGLPIQGPGHDQPLIAVGETGQAFPDPLSELDEPPKAAASLELEREVGELAFRSRGHERAQRPRRLGREPAVGVDEEDPVSPGSRSPGQKLHTPSPRRRDDPGSVVPRDLIRPVRRSSVHDEGLDDEIRECLQVVEEQGESTRLVEGRDDDRKARHGRLSAPCR
jgi:hypothetical protein